MERERDTLEKLDDAKKKRNINFTATFSVRGGKKSAVQRNKGNYDKKKSES